MEQLQVLLVSENNEKSSVVKGALSLMDINRIRVVYDYNDAIALLKTHSVSMLIVEMAVPTSGITAVEFIQMIRKDMEHFAHIQEIPIILLAGEASREDVEAARDSGATEFIVYPFSISHLKRVVKSVIDSPRKFIVSENFFGPDRRRKDETPPWGASRRSTDGEEDNDE